VELIADEIGIATRSLESVERRAKQENGGGQQSRPAASAPRTRPATAKVSVGVEPEGEPF